MLTLTNRIDMRPGAVPLVIHLGQYDSDFSLVFELYSSAGNFTVESGTTAMIRGTKTDGNAYDADATIDISAKTVTVAGSEQMTAAKGRNVYELVLTKSDKVLSTANFILDVERAAMDADTIASESVLKELNAIIAGAATATEAAADAASAADRAEDAAESVSSASAQIATNTADIADLKADNSELKNAFNSVFNVAYSSNLWNPDTTIIGQLNLTYGSVNESATGYVTTDYIPFSTSDTIYEYYKKKSDGTLTQVSPGVGNGNTICFYDTSKEFIEGKAATGWSIPFSIETQNVAYIRVTIAKSHFTNSDRIYGLFKSAVTASTFEEYKEYNVLDDEVQVPQIPKNVSEFTNDARYLTESALESEINPINEKLNDTTVLKQSKNLWNYSETVVGQLSDQDGTVNPSQTDYVTTGYISFETGESFYVYYLNYGVEIIAVTPSSSNGSKLCCYDKNKTFLGFIKGSSFGTPPETIPTYASAVKFIRFTFAKSAYTNANRKYGIFKHSLSNIADFDLYYHEYEVALPQKNFALIAYGDSLTAGTGSTDNDHRYLNQCATALGAKNCAPYGYGGSGSKAVAFTAGALSAYVPPSTRSFALKYADLSTNVSIALNQLSNKMIVVDEKQYVITQTGATSYSLPNDYPTSDHYKPLVVADSRNTADIYVIWVGTNDNGYQWDIIDAMIKKVPHNQYVVMGLTRLGTDTTAENEQKAYEKYGSHFFNTRVQIINNAFAVLGMTPTAEDTAAMNDGLMPPSLLYDDIHFNDDGYEAIGKLLAEHIQSLGYDYQTA